MATSEKGGMQTALENEQAALQATRSNIGTVEEWCQFAMSKVSGAGLLPYGISLADSYADQAWGNLAAAAHGVVSKLRAVERHQQRRVGEIRVVIANGIRGDAERAAAEIERGTSEQASAQGYSPLVAAGFSTDPYRAR